MSGLSSGAEPDVVAILTAGGVHRGDPVGVAITDDWIALSGAGADVVVARTNAARVVTAVEAALRPRWTWWSADGAARPLLDAGLPPLAVCWDLAAVHRLLVGGWSDDPARVWASAAGLPEAGLPTIGQLDLLDDLDPARGRLDDGDPEDPVGPDGYLRPEWAHGGWSRTSERVQGWAGLAIRVAEAQRRVLAGSDIAGSALVTAHVESAAELVAAELGHVGLPVDRAAAESVIREFAGRRPVDGDDARQVVRERDQRVHRLLPGGDEPDLRSPSQVKAMLSRIGLDLPDTRSWRLERHIDAHPVVEALLAWRTAERYATTYGYAWLDKHLGDDGRLRGHWGGSDGGAGRMTASAGLHNMPAALRAAVRAEPGHVLVRADLGQVEPRVLAAVSGDRGLAAAAQADDLYLPVADQLKCDRKVAKVAMLAAMYGGTSGAAAGALAEMRKAYPAAMRFLRAADTAGRESRAIRTYGGRLLPLQPLDPTLEGEVLRSVVASRGRYIRNAVVQGAAAEFFKAWTATVRASLDVDGEVVMCLHDELLLHVRRSVAQDAVQLLRAKLDTVATQWFPANPVRFVADVAVVQAWSEAKG